MKFLTELPDEEFLRHCWQIADVAEEVLEKSKIMELRKVLPVLTGDETPEELEHKSGFPEEPSLCGIYHQVYEKARYGNGCTKEDLERLNEIRRSNQKNTESKYKKTREE